MWGLIMEWIGKYRGDFINGRLEKPFRENVALICFGLAILIVVAWVIGRL